jgi:hypothetical protein
MGGRYLPNELIDLKKLQPRNSVGSAFEVAGEQCPFRVSQVVEGTRADSWRFVPTLVGLVLV